MAQLELSRGIQVNYFGSWVATGVETSWNADWRIEGSKGVLVWRDDTLRFSNKPSGLKKIPLVKWPVAHQAYLLRAFSTGLDTGVEPETSGNRNLNSLATTYAVVRAAGEGRRVMVSEMLESPPRRKKAP
jgi:predicted dehydrogenase